MLLTAHEKLDFIDTIKKELSKFPEIDKIFLFGSFVKSDNPNDIDIAIIQNSKENFLTLSLKYRKVLRALSKKIPLDIIPIKKESNGIFLDEIYKGQVVYEK